MRHLRAQRPEDRDLLWTLLVGGREHAPVPARDRGQGEPDAGIAARAFDDRTAGLQVTCLDRRLDHRDADSVLHRAAGIEVLELGEHGARIAGREPVDPHQRRVSNRAENVRVPHAVRLLEAQGVCRDARWFASDGEDAGGPACPANPEARSPTPPWL